MKKVALLKSRLQAGGGLEKVSRHLLEAFARHGCQVTLLTTERCTIEGVKTVKVCSASKWSFLHLLRFDRACQKWLQIHPQDIVFGMERNSFQTHYRAGNGVHAVYLKQRSRFESFFKGLSFRFNPLHLLVNHFEKRAFESPLLQILFTNSAMVREEILQRYDLAEKKVLVIHNGVEWDHLQLPFEESFPRPEGVFSFLFVGSGFRRKGLALALGGFARLPRGVATFTVVGKDKETKYFERLAEKLGIAKEVFFVGKQSNVIPFYQNADCLVLPTIYDPFANVTLEALSMGLTVVTSSFNGGKEVLLPETGCIIKDLNDLSAIESALLWALARPKTKSRALSIRNSVKELELSTQLDKIVQLTLSSS